MQESFGHKNTPFAYSNTPLVAHSEQKTEYTEIPRFIVQWKKKAQKIQDTLERRTNLIATIKLITKREKKEYFEHQSNIFFKEKLIFKIYQELEGADRIALINGHLNPTTTTTPPKKPLPGRKIVRPFPDPTFLIPLQKTQKPSLRQKARL
jgi:hypothetical protein